MVQYSLRRFHSYATQCAPLRHRPVKSAYEASHLPSQWLTSFWNLFFNSAEILYQNFLLMFFFLLLSSFHWLHRNSMFPIPTSFKGSQLPSRFHSFFLSLHFFSPSPPSSTWHCCLAISHDLPPNPHSDRINCKFFYLPKFALRAPLQGAPGAIAFFQRTPLKLTRSTGFSYDLINDPH